MTDALPAPLPADLLPPGVRSRFVPGINGLRMHLLEAGHDVPGRPVVLLLHGFPELAYSWRHQLPALAAAGFHAIAPDLRGYGRTTGWAAGVDAPVAPYRWFSLVRDMLALVLALGHRQVHAVVGHDFGSPLAAWCALLRPDVFARVVLMSAPFGGPPPLPFDTASHPPRPASDVHAALAALPRPRLHYQWYYSRPSTAAEMDHPPQGLLAFLRAYYHHKSADWPANQPHALPGWTAEALARLPTYYVMDAAATMPATVAPHLPTAVQIAACHWLPDAVLAVYVAEYTRTGFQGGLNWYRNSTDPAGLAELQLMAGRAIQVPAQFIAGAADWGIHQRPGAFAAMQAGACADLRGCHLLPGAGHWVQQEQPEAVNRLLLGFLQPA
ncbi:MAG: alpha/beta hydrolase [Aquabacterium sp.]|nr:alpha/beta hydrolase [Aquabacterium sp.]